MSVNDLFLSRRGFVPSMRSTARGYHRQVEHRQPRHRFWFEMALGIVSAALLVVTLVWNDWIELVFKVDPDASSGALEWLIVGLSFALTVTCFALAQREWRRTLAPA
jgi:hypothetical protein